MDANSFSRAIFSSLAIPHRPDAKVLIASGLCTPNESKDLPHCGRCCRRSAPGIRFFCCVGRTGRVMETQDPLAAPAGRCLGGANRI